MQAPAQRLPLLLSQLPSPHTSVLHPHYPVPVLQKQGSHINNCPPLYLSTSFPASVSPTVHTVLLQLGVCCLKRGVLSTSLSIQPSFHPDLLKSLLCALLGFGFQRRMVLWWELGTHQSVCEEGLLCRVASEPGQAPAGPSWGGGWCGATFSAPQRGALVLTGFADTWLHSLLSCWGRWELHPHGLLDGVHARGNPKANHPLLPPHKLGGEPKRCQGDHGGG